MSGHSRNDRDRHRANSSRSHHSGSGTKSRSSNLNDHHSRSHSSRSGVKSEDSGKSRSGESNWSSSRSGSNANLAFNDMSIARLVKILAMLESKKEFLASCSQIEELLLIGENQAYIQRSFSRLAVDFEQVFYGLPSTCHTYF